MSGSAGGHESDYDYGKIDAGLAAALSEPGEPGERFQVSVRALRPPDPDERREFAALGGMGADAGLPVMSARLTREGIGRLTGKPWVRLVSLSRRLDPSSRFD